MSMTYHSTVEIKLSPGYSQF